jgi:hypothetical protein
MLYRTHAFAKTAIYAGACVHNRIQETLVILLHGYALPGTYSGAGMASATILFVSKLKHYTNLSFNAHALAIKNCLSLDVHPTYNIDKILETTLVVPTAMK